MKDFELELDTTATAELEAQNSLDLALDLGSPAESDSPKLALDSGTSFAAMGLSLDVAEPVKKAAHVATQTTETPPAFAKSAFKQPAPQRDAEPEQPKILSQTVCEDDPSALKPLILLLVFGLIGAACYAGISAVYFSIGRRAGILAIAFFAAVGARMATDDLRSPRTRWNAAFLAGGSAVAGKALLVLLLFNLYPNFSAEDWMNFAEPGKSNALYFEQSIENALDSSGGDGRTGQEKLDERFSKSWNNQDSSPGAASDEEYESTDEEEAEYVDEDEDAGKALSFSQVFPKLFDGFDLPLVIICMVLAYRMSRQSD